MKKFKVELKGELLFLDIEAKDVRHAIEKAFKIIRNVIPADDEHNVAEDWRGFAKEVPRKKLVRNIRQEEITSTAVTSIMNLEGYGFVVEEKAKEMLFRAYYEPADILKIAQAKQDKTITVEDILKCEKKTTYTYYEDL